MVEALAPDELDDALAAAGTVVILGWAQACGACYQIGRLVELAAEEFRGVDFYRLDVRDAAAGDAVRRLGISAAPTLLVYRAGVEQARFDEPRDAAGLWDLLAGA